MPAIRAFIAVEIDPLTRQKISKLISILKKSEADVKWAAEDQMHLTLKFLGNIDKGNIQRILMQYLLSQIISNLLLSAFLK